MPARTVSRRRFLATASAGVAGLGLSAAVVRGAPGANERICVGTIGCGGRGSDHLNSIARLKDKQNVRVVAVCDVWQTNLQRAAANMNKAFGEAPRTFTRFSEMLQQKDVDAVTIATPDFAHGPILVAALEAGKDVYVEKPMTIELSYANDALDLARKHNRVVQVGTQYRSQPQLLGVTKEVAAGTIGKISRVTSAACFNQNRWKRTAAELGECVANDVDWDAYLLHLPKRSFDASLLREWQLHRDTSNGMPGLWMVHYVDAMAMMMNASYPTTAVAHGGNYVWKDGREHADTVSVLLEYPEGFIFDWAMSLGTNADWRFSILGIDGTIEPQGQATLAAKEWVVSSRGAAKPDESAPRKIEPIPGGDHMENWLECIRSRQRPRADIQFGHQHAVASIMSAAALTSGKRQAYDLKQRSITPA